MCEPDQADFWSVYGIVFNAHGEEDRVCIGDYNSEAQAKTVVNLLLGV